MESGRNKKTTFIIGYVNDEEYKELESKGFVIEDADYYDLIGRGKILGRPKGGLIAVVIPIDTDIFEILFGNKIRR